MSKSIEVKGISKLPNGSFSVTVPVKLFKAIYNALPEGFKVIFAEHCGRLYGIFVTPAESVDEIVHNLQQPADDERRGKYYDWFQEYLQVMRRKPSNVPAPVNTRPPTPEEIAEQSKHPPRSLLMDSSLTR